MQVAAIDTEALMRLEVDFEVEIARRPTGEPRRALPGQTDQLPFAHTLRNLHVERARGERYPPSRADLWHAQADLARTAGPRIVEIDDDARVVVLPTSFRPTHASPATAADVAEQLGEEVAEIGRIFRRNAVAGELEAGVPIGRRTEILSRLVLMPELVVGGAPLWVGEHGVGFVHFLHVCIGIRLLRHVRMVFACQLAVVFLDLVGAGRALDAKYLVVIPEFH